MCYFYNINFCLKANSGLICKKGRNRECVCLCVCVKLAAATRREWEKGKNGDKNRSKIGQFLPFSVFFIFEPSDYLSTHTHTQIYVHVCCNKF